MQLLILRLVKCNIVKHTHHGYIQTTRYFIHCYLFRGSRPELFCKKSVLKNFVNSKENTCARVSFLMKLQASYEPHMSPQLRLMRRSINKLIVKLFCWYQHFWSKSCQKFSLLGTGKGGGSKDNPRFVNIYQIISNHETQTENKWIFKLLKYRKYRKVSDSSAFHLLEKQKNKHTKK